MTGLHIEATAMTPLVIFYPEASVLKIEGKMIPEDVVHSFAPIKNWIENYFIEHKKLHLLFRLYYYNTSSSRQFLLLCKKLDEYFANGKDISVRWEHEKGDDESKADAEEFLNGVHYTYEIKGVSN